MCILGTMNFPEYYIAANILDKLMDSCLEFGVYPRNYDGKTPLWPDAVRLDKLLYFTLGPQLDKPVLPTDCGSDVLAGAQRSLR